MDVVKLIKMDVVKLIKMDVVKLIKMDVVKLILFFCCCLLSRFFMFFWRHSSLVALSSFYGHLLRLHHVVLCIMFLWRCAPCPVWYSWWWRAETPKPVEQVNFRNRMVSTVGEDIQWKMNLKKKSGKTRLWYSSWVCGQSKATNSFSYDNSSPRQDLNSAPPECKAKCCPPDTHE